MDAYLTIKRVEGVRNGLYRGTFPNIARNCIINVGETVVYDAAKDGFISGGYMKDGISCHFSSDLCKDPHLSAITYSKTIYQSR